MMLYHSYQATIKKWIESVFNATPSEKYVSANMFQDKVVLITGGSAGIGEATAELFAKEGARVAIVGRNEVKLNEVAEKCSKYGSQALAIKADLSKDEETDTIVKKTIKKFGKLDVLVNNAGIFKEAKITADNFLDVFDEVINVNIRSSARITHHAVPYIIQSKGNIVNISSVAGKTTKIGNITAYRTSKAALNHFTRCCAAELAEYGVRVNSISPGPVYTDIFKGTSLTQGADDVIMYTALKKISSTMEIADLILYVASDKARSITGADYVIDNGWLVV